MLEMLQMGNENEEKYFFTFTLTHWTIYIWIIYNFNLRAFYCKIKHWYAILKILSFALNVD